MSGQEIERKYLVRHGGAYRRVAHKVFHIRQGYIPASGATVRVRVRDEEAFLTIKSKSRDGGLSRYEFEKSITLEEAEQLLKLCSGGTIDKHRYLVQYGTHTIEVDEFHGENEGLILAEIELSSVDDVPDLPSFLGPEVTGDPHFYNSNLLSAPYATWRTLVPEDFR